jgi:hypothetical protein
MWPYGTTRLLQLHGYEAGIESSVMSDAPGVYQSRLDIIRELLERRTTRSILIGNTVDPLCVPRNRSSRIDQVAGAPDLGRPW